MKSTLKELIAVSFTAYEYDETMKNIDNFIFIQIVTEFKHSTFETVSTPFRSGYEILELSTNNKKLPKQIFASFFYYKVFKRLKIQVKNKK